MFYQLNFPTIPLNHQRMFLRFISYGSSYKIRWALRLKAQDISWSVTGLYINRAKIALPFKIAQVFSSVWSVAGLHGKSFVQKLYIPRFPGTYRRFPSQIPAQSLHKPHLNETDVSLYYVHHWQHNELSLLQSVGRKTFEFSFRGRRWHWKPLLE